MGNLRATELEIRAVETHLPRYCAYIATYKGTNRSQSLTLGK